MNSPEVDTIKVLQVHPTRIMLFPHPTTGACLLVYKIVHTHTHTHTHTQTTYMDINNGKESDNMEKIEKQSNPKVIN